MKYHLVTLGCQMNQSDSERVKRVLEGMGAQWTDSEEEANIIGILACSVRQKAIDKVYTKIGKWNKRKASHNLITFISGCVLPADKEKFLKLFDIVFAMRELPQFPQMLSQYGITTPAGLERDNLNPKEEISFFWKVKPKYNSSFEAFIPIQNGCDKFCSFCAVPYTRGREVSRPSNEIVDEVKSLVEKGYKSITLLGQNVNSYGLDKKGNEITFSELLDQIGQIGESTSNQFWVYFTSPHPRDMGREVVEVIAKYKCLAKQIHLPIQSGDDKVLIKMNRKHSVKKYRETITAIKELIPEATLFTDIIVGFTGETDEQFENTRKVMKEFKYNMAYIAMYSKRPGAASYSWPDDIDIKVKKERLALLTKDLAAESGAYNSNMIDRVFPLLVRDTDKKQGFLSGQTEGKITVRFASEDHSLIGQIVNVKITSSTNFSVEGELVSSEVEVVG
ncbi:tRNA (N6-isopentenyl adenosine(37)-C2)-methylthiotransferase MiaB [Carboxylicivirga sp. M1479]|uniref:tRNA (N6-isopentenyl adenosine(37)-C2)-methylthiotransferase MiaB n=1 Tax=Carboxylicivirga sp. M1479 TaxID=2594476 RepID=UPI00117836F5|nr:tRNA (N6-isopentenyl adenosine(37)-C2)-methylthiotransferase MiaB [Carboxylicivirga sp. M1479]TRX70301.1 tRNA (N6-isopentenyl adenosine(37)-C2)-methylthiotransferase MiaB [Carboxylicivirga sp. M1479]